jgi:alkylhydroperoxidase family enzyme
MMPPGVPPLALFRTLAWNPRVLDKIRAGSLLDRGSLPRRDRELVILRTTARCGSEYEWGVHAAVFARRVGLTDAEIAGSVHADWRDPLWSERDRQSVRLVDELHRTSTLSDELWQALRPHWSEAQLVELLVLAGFYHAISFVANGLAIALEDAALRFPLSPLRAAAATSPPP